MTRVLVGGVTGRMGRAVIAAASDRDDVDIVAGVSRDPPGEIDGVPTEAAADLEAILTEYDPDVLVDFSTPDASRTLVAACADADVACVVGTTGFDKDEPVFREASESVPVLVASNFSRGVQALLRAVEGAVSDLPGYDVELTETHHNGKRDAPSGTAKTLLDRIAAAGGPDERVHGREGDAPRQPDEIGVHARRAGGIAGEHEVLIANDHEDLRLSHRAADRGVFADGALDAATWVTGRHPGRYEFSEVISE
ncbi:4-hydroxy-tetrahydrodipicolinate reductase [Haladaptatus sp. W1]|uniref:4-hydroxy-tetrahydrodipicolinate reductase n=1 Tax=Haladaptatus sp. W1 TaxID=1897478 RepID=UPI0009F594B7|nr:4-hydroxy-tetrahydrodipicolinate reductase [Haladaptatus sp. W1]